MEEIVNFFHHLHHSQGRHEVHHCGGAHIKINPKVDYSIRHCLCKKHSINKPRALGHASDKKGEPLEVLIEFSETCPHGGWHIESGILTED